jgi:3-mercaptopyruvate sulfurtransferase SseA
MMPTNEIWIEHMNSLKINTNNSIVLYDDYGIVGACRAYFMFKVFNPS